MFNTKTREGAKLFSRKCGAIELDTANISKTTQSGMNPIGSPTVRQLELGVAFPNVQSAIEDLANNYQIPINGVMTIVGDDTVADQTPKWVPMTEQLIITGNATELSKVIHVYGIPVILNVGDNKSAIAGKIVTTLTPYKLKNIAFESVSKASGYEDRIDVRFIDTNPHPNFNAEYDGITINGTTTTQAVSGYGTWTYLGQSPITTLAVAGAINLKYYKRIA